MTDGKIDLAVGVSARSKSWKNQSWLWSDLVTKLITEHRTSEKYKEFISLSKADQLGVKDVGGYVGGFLRGGRRKPGNVLHRQLITLDLDFAHDGFWLDFQMSYNNAAVLHSTHKHSPKDPRYRLVMPVSRECTPDEYAAVARYIAGDLGIDLFDTTTFQAERLMFWPSCSSDAEYYAEAQNGPWLDVDETLANYTDWTDSSSWPTAGSALEAVKNDVEKQEDPANKKGLIGAFCRTYSIPEVIEAYLQDVYVPAGDDRYTYVNGSAGAGLAVYEDKFAFSHHGTDPCGGKLCNSYDLVRIHKFGHLDAQSDSRSKSMGAMDDLCTSDKNVKRTIAAEQKSSANYDFDDDYEIGDEETDTEWVEELELDVKGKYLSTAKNISLIMSNDPCLKGVFKENLFDNKKYVTRSLPWRKIETPEPIRNVDFSGIRNYIESIYGISGALKVDDSTNLEFEKHSFHPVKEYLDPLKWDGVKRVDSLLVDFFGADDNIYTREAIRKMLVGAVARIYRPGIKFDLVLTLVSDEQGTGKSTFINKLGRQWFSDSFHTVKGKESFEQLQGAWLIEMAELSGLKKSEVEPVKHFITKQEDTFRPAYGRSSETFKRKCVFFATTNEREFLDDPSGNRRFMPIIVNPDRKTKDILFSDDLDKDIDQIWAEAKTLYEDGEPLYLSRQAELIAAGRQRTHSHMDDRTGLIASYLDRPLPENWDSMELFERRDFLNDPLSEAGTKFRTRVCVAEVWAECLGKDPSDMDRYKTRSVNDILRILEDWEPAGNARVFPVYGRQRYYQRKIL